MENRSKNEHDNDKLRENLQRELEPLLEQLNTPTEGTKESFSSGAIGKNQKPL